MFNVHSALAEMADRQSSFLPLPLTPEALWLNALEELKYQMTKATFHALLAGSCVIPEASSPAFLVVAVRNHYALEWVVHRLQPMIERTLAGVAGYTLKVCFVPHVSPTMRSDLRNASPKPFSRILPHPELGPAGVSPHKRNLNQKQPVAGSRIVAVPAHTTPQLLTNHLTQGDPSMSNQTPPTPIRVRIYSHLTQSRFLHVEDALSIGKVRIFAGNYRQGQGMHSYAHAFVDIPDARVIFSALVKGEPGFSYKEYKGTPSPVRHPGNLDAGSEQGRRNGNGAVSRVLSVVVKGENVYIELQSGPGKLTPTGAITPHGRPEVEVNVSFKLYEARRMAATVLAYLQAWDVLRMMANQQVVSRPVPYLLVPATNETNGHTSPANEMSTLKGVTNAPDGTPASNDRPVTRKAAVPKAKSVSAPVNIQRANGQSEKPGTAISRAQKLHYGDGHPVDGRNLTEVQTFQRYVSERKTVPESKAVLLAYYQQQVQSPAGNTG